MGQTFLFRRLSFRRGVEALCCLPRFSLLIIYQVSKSITYSQVIMQVSDYIRLAAAFHLDSEAKYPILRYSIG